jgi:hypothetical protein
VKRACGCRVWRLWKLVLTLDCGLFWVCLRESGLREHEDYTKAVGRWSLRRRVEDRL